MLNKLIDEMWMNICWTGNGLYKHDIGYLETWLPEHHSHPLVQLQPCLPKPWAG